MNNGDYILNVDWLAISGIQSIAAAREKFLMPSQRAQRALQERSAEQLEDIAAIRADGADIVAEGTVAIGNLLLYVRDYGTRFYSVVIDIYISRELFGVLLAYPRAKNMGAGSFQLKVHNRWLYSSQCWDILAYVMRTLELQPHNISRLDLAADFNRFAGGLHPIEFIRQFMAGDIKKKGRSEGRVNFVQEYVTTKNAGVTRDSLNFNALTIGKRSSDACAYLYNKTLEMQEGTIKPWIVEAWTAAGLDTNEVWRLEISMTSKAMRFYDRNSGEFIDFRLDNLMTDAADVTPLTLFHVYLQSLFFFFRPSGGLNVSREKMIPLFGEIIPFRRSVLRDNNPSDRSERMLIKKMHTLVDRYRGFSRDDQFEMRAYAKRLAESSGLGSWYAEKQHLWNDTKYKS